MAYIDETYGKQLEEALRGLASRPALGQPWFGFHESEVPAGVLLFTATTHSRVLYANFWEYIQNKNLVKTEEEWQSIYREQGWCPFYSDGDGIDTFRMPSAPLYLHGANINDAGGYTAEGLPNITGTFEGRGHTSANINYGGALQKPSSGAFSMTIQGGTDTGTGSAESETKNVKNDKVTFDASKSNSIYGNSSHVTPETSKMLFGVWAIATPQQPIPDATAEGIMTELGEHSARFSNYLPLAGGTMKGEIIAPECYIMQANDFDVTTAPSSSKFRSSLRTIDKNGKLMAHIQHVQWSGNATNVLRILLGNSDGTEGKSLVISNSGTFQWDGKNIERIEAKDDTYIRYTNGLQLCWGTTNIAANAKNKTVTFPAAFKGQWTYRTIANVIAEDYGYTVATYNPSSSATTITAMGHDANYAYTRTVCWIAVGTWK